MKKDINRKTTVPVRTIPEIVAWLIKNVSREELEFMAYLANSGARFKLLNSIFTRLTDYNMHELFYEKDIRSGDDLLVYRAAKRGEVAGLKAFAMACQAANEELKNRKVG